MYKKELNALLSRGGLQNYFLLYGGDNFQVELYANLIKKQFNADEKLSLYFEEYNFAKASDFLGLGSLFCEKKLLEIKLNRKTADGKVKKVSTKELKEFTSLIEICKANSDNFLLLELYDADSKQGELERIFNEKTGVARFFKVSSANEAAQLLKMRAEELGIDITQNALFTLFNAFDENLYLAAAELNKFQGLRVEEKTISEFCQSLNLSTFESFFDKLFNKNDFRHGLEKMLDSMNEIDIINALYSEFYKLFKISMMAKVHGRVDFKELFGFTPPPNVQKELSTRAFMLKFSKFKDIFTLLLQSEHELKVNAKKLEKKELLTANLLKLGRILKG